MQIAVLVWLLFGMGAAVVATNKRRGGCSWFAVGFLLGPIGFMMALVAPDKREDLPKTAPRDAAAPVDSRELPGGPKLWFGICLALIVLVAGGYIALRVL